MHRSLTRCPCWPASTANQSGLMTLTFNLLTLKVESESTCDVGYLSANFSLPRPLRSRLRPDVRDRLTSDKHTYVRQHRRLMPPGRRHQWRRSVVKSEGSGSLRSSHQTRSRPKLAFVFGAEKGYLAIFGFFCFRPKMNFH